MFVVILFKMDKAATLGDAPEYIKELLQEVDKFQNELKENEEEDCEKDNAEVVSSKLDMIHEGTSTVHLPPIEHNKNSPCSGEKGKTEVQVEVNQIDKRDFLIRLLCQHERGGFVRLMEAINALQLKVIDANVTIFNGQVLHILRVQENGTFYVTTLIIPKQDSTSSSVRFDFRTQKFTLQSALHQNQFCWFPVDATI